jgi:signal transduction histidine kinase
MHKEELDRKNAKIHIGKLPVIKGVPFQIKQLLFNLFNNAVKYKHPDRDLQISVTHELVNASEIQEYKVEPAMQYHKISITDNGVGFDARYTSKIFEIFQRLHGKHEYPGTGVGLAICKKIVENHHGFITAQSEPGKGTTFYISIPV